MKHKIRICMSFNLPIKIQCLRPPSMTDDIISIASCFLLFVKYSAVTTTVIIFVNRWCTSDALYINCSLAFLLFTYFVYELFRENSFHLLFIRKRISMKRATKKRMIETMFFLRKESCCAQKNFSRLRLKFKVELACDSRHEKQNHLYDEKN